MFETVESSEIRLRLVLLRNDVNALWPYRDFEETNREIELARREIEGMDRELVARGERPSHPGTSRAETWGRAPQASGPAHHRSRRRVA